MPRNYGHTMGAKNVEVICEDAYHMGIQYLTLYAFSTENWNRPDTEVEALMKLLATYLKNCIKRADKNNMRIPCDRGYQQTGYKVPKHDSGIRRSNQKRIQD